MAQIKIYGLRRTLSEIRPAVSDAIHSAVMHALQYPKEKRFHRFILLDDDGFIFPEDRSDNYIILEISLFEGRNVETKKQLIKQLYTNILDATDIKAHDLEITIIETPKGNWGIRGMPGDELSLGYQVEV